MEDLRGLDWSLAGFETVKREGGLPDGSASEGSTCQCRRPKRHRFDTWVGRIPWRRKWQPAQYSCLETPMDRGAWWDTVHGVAKSRTRLSVYAHKQRHTHTHDLK